MEEEQPKKKYHEGGRQKQRPAGGREVHERRTRAAEEERAPVRTGKGLKKEGRSGSFRPPKYRHRQNLSPLPACPWAIRKQWQIKTKFNADTVKSRGDVKSKDKVIFSTE